MLGRRTAIIATLMASATTLTGCVSASVSDLKTSPGYVFEFQSTKPLTEVYQNAVGGLTQCLTGWTFRTKLSIRPRMSNDRKSATIDYLQQGLNDGYWASIEIGSATSGTNVKTYAINNRGMRNLGTYVQRWVSGDRTCDDFGNYLTDHIPIIE